MADAAFVGTVVLPDRVIDQGYVLIGDGKAVGAGPAPAGERHGGADFLVMPGAIDAQVLIAEPGSGRFISPLRVH